MNKIIIAAVAALCIGVVGGIAWHSIDKHNKRNTANINKEEDNDDKKKGN